MAMTSRSLNLAFRYLLITLYIIGTRVWGVVCISADQDLTLTVTEKRALDELKARTERILPQDYMKSEAYLINWVRAGEGDVNEAEKLLKENLKWRKRYNMDKILGEDFSGMEQEFPIDLDGLDYEGRPVLFVHVGEWDVRTSHLKGTHPENYRYSIQALELASQKVRDAQAQGKPVTRFQIIFDFKGFNLQTHACLQCLPPYLRFISAFQTYYPGMVDNIIFINTPRAMESVFNLLRPIAGPSLRKSLKIFGTNKREWQKFLFQLIPRDQLDSSLGGTKESNQI